jgi:uncharacterized membrane protein YecN with MAPEG domain
MSEETTTAPLLSITRLYAGILSLVWSTLMLGVISMRQNNDVKLGDGGIPTLATRIRGHANFVETTPYFLIVLAMNELANDVPKVWIHLAGAVFTFGRVVHAIGFSSEQPSTPARIAGTFGAVIPLSSLSLYGMLGWSSTSHGIVIPFMAMTVVLRLVVMPMLKSKSVDKDK